MSVITKIKVYATGAIILAMLGGFYTLTDTTTSTDDDQYTLSSKWIPGVMPIHHEVIITVTVDGYPLISRRRRVSPWMETLAATKGAMVTLTVFSRHPGTGFVDCVIMKNGRSVGMPGGYDTLPGGPGTVKCTA
jgi:hypothetical protein